MLSILAILVIALLLSPTPSLATIAPPEKVINETTKECSDFVEGDECTRCKVPNGWEVTTQPCPSGYKLTTLKSICEPVKSGFCCNVNHSGSGGKCDDVVVNTSTKKCAFVDDIGRCDQLPSGWERAKYKLDKKYSGLCPMDYQWEKENIQCDDTTHVDYRLTFLGRVICFFKKIFGSQCVL